MIQIKNISKSYRGKKILSNISFNLGSKQKVALVGPNGVGKSTLLKILAGLESPDSGTIEIPSDFLIGYLPQEIDLSRDETIEEYLKEVTGIGEIERKLKLLENELTDVNKINEYSDLQQLFQNLDGYNFERKINIMLAGFNLKEIGKAWPLKLLSGGQKVKVALIGVLLKGVNFLLLDEPTNNLDLPAIVWLETYLKQASVPCIIISHDRVFLDKIVDKVIEIDWFSHSASIFSGNYSDYLEVKIKKIQREKQLFKLQQEEIKRLEETIRHNKEWAQRGVKQVMPDHDKYIRGARRDRATKMAKKAKSIEKKIEQMDRISVTKERVPLSIPLDLPANKAKHSINLENVLAGYDNTFQIGPINLEVKFGQRIALLGENGSGKSTLLKAITGNIPVKSGSVKIGLSLVIGDLLQIQENLDFNKTVYEFLKEKTKAEDEEIYKFLIIFNFTYEDRLKKIRNLSPGERARLLLLLFSLLSVNVLILDEPTNHLDLEALEALEEVLKTYKGTVICVSHDRHFLDALNPDRIYLLKNGSLNLIENWSVYEKSLIDRAEKMIRTIK